MPLLRRFSFAFAAVLQFTKVMNGGAERRMNGPAGMGWAYVAETGRGG